VSERDFGVVGFGKVAIALVGQPAKRQAVTNANTVYGIGDLWSSLNTERNAIEYQLRQRRDDALMFKSRGYTYLLKEISAMIAKSLNGMRKSFG